MRVVWNCIRIHFAALVLHKFLIIKQYSMCISLCPHTCISVYVITATMCPIHAFTDRHYYMYSKFKLLQIHIHEILTNAVVTTFIAEIHGGT